MATEQVETLIVARGGSFVPVAARIAALVAQGWKVGEVRFEIYKPVPVVRVPPVVRSQVTRKRSR